MKTINLLTKGNYTICSVINNEKINYVMYKNIQDAIYELCKNYNEINITEKNIRISNSKLKLNIENYKDNTNVLITPIIKKLQKDYRDLKIKKLRKQKIKRISVFSCVVLLSGGIIVNALNSDKIVYKTNDIKSNITQNVIEEIKDYPKINFIEEVSPKEEIVLLNEETKNNINNYEISFESRVDSDKFQITKAYYNQIITKLSNEYGIDPKIMLAIATQESGIHDPNLKGSAIGLMQIERAVWVGQSITAYNYEKCANETLYITENKLKDLEFNIRVSCMILKDCLNKSYYNLPIAIQMYNFGYGNIKKVFNSSYGDNISFEKICQDYDISWLENRENINEGDNQYLEHILSYIEDLEDIQIMNNEGILRYSFINKAKTL